MKVTYIYWNDEHHELMEIKLSWIMKQLIFHGNCPQGIWVICMTWRGKNRSESFLKVFSRLKKSSRLKAWVIWNHKVYLNDTEPFSSKKSGKSSCSHIWEIVASSLIVFEGRLLKKYSIRLWVSSKHEWVILLRNSWRKAGPNTKMTFFSKNISRW